MERTYKVQTQLVTIYREDGTRGGAKYCRRRRWRTWNKHTGVLPNLMDAIDYVTRVRDNATASKWGGIAIVRPGIDHHFSQSYQKVYEAKWGTDNRPFNDFYGPVGDYWKRRIDKYVAATIK